MKPNRAGNTQSETALFPPRQMAGNDIHFLLGGYIVLPMLFKFLTVLYIRTFHFEYLLFLRFALIISVTGVSHPALKKHLLIFFRFFLFQRCWGKWCFGKKRQWMERVRKRKCVNLLFR